MGRAARIAWILIVPLLAMACGEGRSRAIRLDVRGTNALLMGQPEEAIKVLQAARAADPAYADALINLGAAKRIAGQYDAAVEIGQLAVSVAEQPPRGLVFSLPLPGPRPPHRYSEIARVNLLQAYRRLGEGHLRAKQWETARTALSRAEDLFGESAEKIRGFAQRHRSLHATLEFYFGQAYAKDLAGRADFAERASKHFGRYIALGGSDPNALKRARQFIHRYPQRKMR